MRPSLGDWVRWGWLATTLALGAALLTTAWVGLDRARAAASTLDAGQGQILLEALRQSVRAEPALPDSARLDSLLGLHEDGGLRFLALYDPERRLLAAVPHRAGKPAAQPARLAGVPRLHQVVRPTFFCCRKPNLALLVSALVGSLYLPVCSASQFGRYASSLPSISLSGVHHPGTFCPCNTCNTIETILWDLHNRSNPFSSIQTMAGKH